MGHVVEIGGGAVRQAARENPADRFQARKPGLLVKAFARRECPVRHEYALHVDHDRSLDLEVQALRWSGRLQRKPRAFAKVHAADKAPAVLGSDQGLQVSLSGAGIVEDVCEQADCPRRTVDRSEHLGKRDVAILERVDLIAWCQRTSGDGLADTRKRCDGWLHAGVRIPPARQVGCGRGSVAPIPFERQCRGRSVNAVDAEQDLQDRSDQRRQPRNRDPSDDRRGMSLAQHGVHRDCGCSQDVKSRHDRGPMLSEHGIHR